jgi:hypothetical protein
MLFLLIIVFTPVYLKYRKTKIILKNENIKAVGYIYSSSKFGWYLLSIVLESIYSNKNNRIVNDIGKIIYYSGRNVYIHNHIILFKKNTTVYELDFIFDNLEKMKEEWIYKRITETDYLVIKKIKVLK